MFRKIVSNLSFSPALVSQLGFYANRLRAEEVSRKLGLIFTALALVIQSLVIFQPPESANAANGNDFIRGGISSLDDFVKPYDKNTNNLKDILNYFGITREELVSAKYETWTVGSKISWGFESRFSYAQGERKVIVTDSEGKAVTTVYGRPNSLFNGVNGKVSGWSGYSKKLGGWFAIMKNCGNLVTEKIPPPPPKKCPYNATINASDPRCKPCPGKDSLWIDDPTCNAEIVRSKTALNVSKSSIDATSTLAAESDLIRYTLTIENKGLAPESVDIKENLQDILEYSTLADDGGGTFTAATSTLQWPSVDLAAGEKQTRVFAVRMLDKIPATSKGKSEPTSFNCVMTNVFGNQVDVNVKCPTEKVVEKVVDELPTTGPTENLIFGGSVLAVVTYFYFRSRQLKSEIRLVRKNLNTGAI